MRLDQAINEAAACLETAAIPRPRHEARLLLAHATGLGQATLIGYPEQTVDDGALATFRTLVAARANQTPLSRITGRREFWSLEFELGTDTLDPRADSETLVEAALALLPPDRPARILDLGTGTGCLLLAVLSERPRAWGLGIDLAAGACRVAARNAERLGLSAQSAFAAGNWGTALAEEFDLIIANPPYIPRDEIDGLAPEVTRHDPRRALDGGEDGLACYRRLIPECRNLLRRDSALVLEIGDGQATAVTRLMQSAEFSDLGSHQDIAGTVRCLTGRNSGC